MNLRTDLELRRSIPTWTDRDRARRTNWIIAGALVAIAAIAAPASVYLFQELEGRGCKCPAIEEVQR